MKKQTLILLLLIAFCTKSCKKTYNKVFKTKIDVTVTDGNTGLPVKNAKVFIQGYNKPKANTFPQNNIIFIWYEDGLTDSNGKFDYRFNAELKSSFKYTYFCRIIITVPDSSNYTKMEANYITDLDESNVKLGYKNVYKVKFY
jgi:hypothetical protein